MDDQNYMDDIIVYDMDVLNYASWKLIKCHTNALTNEVVYLKMLVFIMSSNMHIIFRGNTYFWCLNNHR